MKGAIAIFAKTPGLSPIKTRLANDVGAECAEVFYRLSVAAISQTLDSVQKQSAGRILPVWALAEEQAPGLVQWQGFAALWTGDGGLGTRMHSVLQRLLRDHDFVMLIGTDSPQISTGIFNRAVELLEACAPDDCIVGPSMDGGFYLFASKKPVGAEIWEGVTYSQDTTLSQLVDLLKMQGRKIHFLKRETDVDTGSDLVDLKRALNHNRKSLIPAQNTLLAWLETLDG